MAENKYYLNQDGLDRLISEIAEKIRTKTSGTITIVEEEENGTVTKTIQNPNNFATIQGIVNFLNSRAKLKINQQTSTSSNQGYTVQNNNYEYNGEEELQIKLGVATSSEIDDMSSNELKYIDLNGLAYYKEEERNYIDKKAAATKIENDQINGHNSLVITDGVYNPVTDTSTNTLVKVNIDEDTINFINVAGKYTAEEATAYNTEHANDDGFVAVQEGDDKPADYRLAVDFQQLEQYVGSNAIDVSYTQNEREKAISLILGTNENILHIDSTGLKTGLNLVKVTTNLDQLYGANVREAYVLQDNNSQPIGDPILVYKDERLENVELIVPTKYEYEIHDSGNVLEGEGKFLIATEKNNQFTITIVSDTVSQEIQAGDQFIIKSSTLTNGSTYTLYDSQGVTLNKTITISSSSTEGQAFKYTYRLADGNQAIVYLDASQLIVESEFGNGLQVDGSGIVSAKIDQNSEKDSQSTPVNFLVVTSNGLKIQGIKSEILRKIDALGTATADTGKYIKSVGINTNTHTLEVKDQGIIPEINTTVANTINSTAITNKTDFSTLEINTGQTGYSFSHNIKVISPDNAVEEVLYTAEDAEVIAGTKEVGDVKVEQVDGLVRALDIKNTFDAMSIPLTGRKSVEELFQKVVAKYNVSSTSSATTLLYSTTGIIEMEIDGVVQSNVVSSYTFGTTGEHIVKYVLSNPTEIPQSIFRGCTALTKVYIPNSVTTIQQQAFNQCTNLVKVNIPIGTTTIGNNVFAGCTSLQDIIISNTVTTIGSGAFSQCTSLTSIVIPNSVTSLGTNTFSGCTNLIIALLSDNIAVIPQGAFQSCTNLIKMSFSSNVTNIGTQAFNGCSSLTNLTIPNNVTTIDNNAFAGCTGLTTLNYDATCEVTSNIGFTGNTSLKTVVIGDTTSSIGTNAFNNCNSLSNITIGSNVGSIGNSAFGGSNSLIRVKVKATSCPTLGTNVFAGNEFKIYVPALKVNDYKEYAGWSAYSDIIEGF